MSLLPNWLTGYDPANAAAAQNADAKLQAMNAVDYAPGGTIYNQTLATQGQAAADALAGTVAADYAAQPSFDPAVQQAQVDQAFTSTLQDQANSLIGGPLGIFWATLKSVLKALPWWVWVAVAAFVFVWLGGPVFVRAYVGKKSK